MSAFYEAFEGLSSPIPCIMDNSTKGKDGINAYSSMLLKIHTVENKKGKDQHSHNPQGKNNGTRKVIIVNEKYFTVKNLLSPNVKSIMALNFGGNTVEGAYQSTVQPGSEKLVMKEKFTYIDRLTGRTMKID